MFKNLNKFEKKIWSRTGLILLMLAASVIAMSVAYCGVLKPNTEPTGIWFQRSGSFVILMAIGCDLFVYRGLKGFTDLQEIKASERYRWLIVLSNIIAFILPLVGTAVWGYGDLIYKAMN